MRVNRLEMTVADVEAAVAWWRELLVGAEVTDEAVVDAAGLELRFAPGDAHALRRLSVQVAPERLERLAAQYQSQIATDGDGARFFHLRAPGDVEVRVFTRPDDEAYAE